jgi:hypothetical protein
MAWKGKRLKPEEWLQWNRENWGGAQVPINEPEPVKQGAGNKLAKISVQQWLQRPWSGLWGARIAADSLDQQRAVQKRLADRKAWKTHFAAKTPKETAEWPKGTNARNHTYWKWMELRAMEHIWRETLERQETALKAWESNQRAEEAADTHPWAHRADIKRVWQGQGSYSWRDASIWRSVVYACWRDKRPGREAWPVWMRPQTGGKKGKPRVLPVVPEPQDYVHPQGRNKRLREVFEGLPTVPEQQAAVAAIKLATGSVPEWMTPRLVDPPKRPGRPRKAVTETAGKVAG